MQAPRPHISVVVPTYNRVGRLRQVITALEQQAYPSDAYEVIIISDGSTDSTREAVGSVRDARVKYLYQSNTGQAIARNSGAAQAQGDYLVFLDHDDELLPAALETAVRALDSDPGLGLVAGGYEQINREGRKFDA